MRVLVADDQPDVLEAARLLLKSSGHTAVGAGTPDAALREARSQPFDVLLVDMNYARDTTSGGEGLDLLQALRASGIDTPVVVMTAWGSVELAVQAMRRGASDFVQKPWDNARLLETIHHHGTQARQQRTDMEIARKVQQRLLGRTTKPVPGLDYAGCCLPIGDVGGDYFDFFQGDRGELAIVVADVSGKGIAAALLMAHLQAALHSHLELMDNPTALVGSANRVFWESSPTEQFATLFYSIYDPATRVLHYVNAGHAAPVLLHADGAAEVLDSDSMPVGLFADWSGEMRSVQLASGDRLIIVSDGILEAGVAENRDFGHEGIVRCCKENSRATAEEMANRILTEAAHSGVSDDMTAVVVNVL